MKKTLALMLALMMALSFSAVSFGEAAEVYEPQYSSFEEHLNAFLSGINLNEKDIFLASQAGEQSVQLLIGQDENGTVNIMASQNQEEIGTLQIDAEAAYLSYQGSVMAIRFDTVQSFVQNLPQKLLGLLAQFGIDPQQLMADVQALANALQTMAAKLVPALEQSSEGNKITITLNSESFGDLMGQAIDDFLADESVAGMINRYAPLFGARITAEQIQQAWQANREAVVAILKTTTCTLTVDQSTGEFTCNGGMDLPENVKAAWDINGVSAGKQVSINTVVSLGNGEQEYRIEQSQSVEMANAYSTIPSKITEHQVVSMNGQEIQVVDFAAEMNASGIPETVLIVMAQQGTEMIRMQYADSTFSAYMQGQEMLFIQYKNEVLTMRAQGSEITMREVENDGDHMTFELNVTTNGNTVTGYINYSILKDENGAEYMQVDITANGEVGAIAQLQLTEKQAFSLLKDSEGVNWITEEQLDTMFNSLVQQALSNINK